MLDFAKSIMCNTKAEVAKVGNNAADDKYQAFILKYGHPNTKEEAEKLIELAKKEGIHPDYIKGLKRGFASRWGNSKYGNAEVIKDGDAWVVLYAEGTKSKEFDSEAEAKRFAAQVGNSKVGNADLLSGNYIILDDKGVVWFRDEHENVNIRNIDSWAQKRISEYQRSIDEIKKGVQEAKQAAKKYGLI